MGVMTPVPPIVGLLFRHDKQLDRFVPCEDRDGRGSLIASVDSLGQHVEPVFGGMFDRMRVVGYRLSSQPSADEEMDEVQKWLAMHDYRRPRDARFSVD